MQIPRRVWHRANAVSYTHLSSKEAACLGAAILAGKAVGIFDSVEAAAESMVDVIARYEPNPDNKEIYDKGYEVYKKMQEDCKDCLLYTSRCV